MNQRERRFVETVWDFYRANGRHDLPWRQTADPYLILVSELMLQQTQVARVVPKYEAFVARWPTAEQLASAPLGDVLRMWQGLGYNRRAKYLHEAAQQVSEVVAGRWPATAPALQTLPGVGSYTAAAVAAFAYNQPVVLVETNVRQVFIYHFFKSATTVSDEDVKRLVAKTLPTENSREWYWALMDYGSHLKQQHGNLASKSKHYTKQSTFSGSDRQIRGAIIRTLQTESATKAQLLKALPTFTTERLLEQLTALEREGLVSRIARCYQLPD